jgi:hypothetical protein
MKSHIKVVSLSFVLASSLALATPALAGGIGYDSTISSPLTTAVKLDVRLSEDMQHRANNLPEKLSDRGSSNRIRGGFGNNGFYGERDLNRLNEKLSKRLTQGLSKKGIEVSDDAPVTLVVTLEDAKPNRPTFKQLSRDPGLSFQSFSLGGAELTGELVDAQGNVLGTMDYRWYESDIRDAAFGGTWTDAGIAIRRFANHAVKDLAQ